MTYWQGNGMAPGYSRDVEQAKEAVNAAEAKLLDTMKRAYPHDSQVRVVHYRGQFEGTVTGHDIYGIRICVRNNHTGKTCKWWAAHVELIGAAA